MVPSLWLLTSVLIIAFGNFGPKSCNPSCSQVKFYLPQAANSECSTNKANCLMEAVFTVDLDDVYYERINLTLTSLNRNDYFREHTMSFSFTIDPYLIKDRRSDYFKPYGSSSSSSSSYNHRPYHLQPYHSYQDNHAPSIIYSCKLPANGGAAIGQVHHANDISYVARVSNSSRACSFIFDRNQYEWPTLANHEKLDLININQYTVNLAYDDETRQLQPEALPIYKMSYLRCCYRSFGGSKYLFILKPSTRSIRSIDFYLQCFAPIPRHVVLDLKGPSQQFLRVNISNSWFNVSIRTDGEWSSVLGNISLPRIPRTNSPLEDWRINWTLPIYLESRSGSIKLEDGLYEMDIRSDLSLSSEHHEKITLTGNGNHCKPIISWLSQILMSLLLLYLI